MTIYYVAGTGSNGNDGSTGSPWRDIDYAINQSSNGDTIRVRDGTYSEVVNIDVANLVVEADTGHAPVIDGLWNGTTFPVATSGLYPGGDVYTDSAAKFSALVKIRASGIVFDGFIVKGSTARCISIADTGGGKLSSAIVRNCTLHTAYTNGIASEHANNVTVQNVEIYNISLLDQDPGKPVNNWYACMMIREQTAGAGGGLIEGCNFHDSYGEGIIVSRNANGVITQDSTIWNTRRTNFYFHFSQNNTLRRCGIFATSGWAYPSDGITFANEHNFDGGGYTYNIGHLVENNVLTGNKRNISASYNGTSNVGGLRDTVIHHNTFLECSLQNIKILSSPQNSNITFKYNIIVQTSLDITNVTETSAITADYNCWHDASPQAAISGENDIEDNPDLVDIGATLAVFADWDADNYALTAVSPCIDAASGSLLAGDYYGFTRTTPDMGALEYSATQTYTVTAGFSASPLDSDGAQSISFDMSSTTTTDPGGISLYTLYKRLRRFGETVWTQFYSSTAASAVHVLDPGAWDIRLVAVSAAGASDEEIKNDYITLSITRSSTISATSATPAVMLAGGELTRTASIAATSSTPAITLTGAEGVTDPIVSTSRGRGRPVLGLQLYNSAGTVLLADWSERASVTNGPSTNEHGFESLGVAVTMTVEEAFYFYDMAPAAKLVLSAGAQIVWEGRVEDRESTTNGIQLTAFGKWRSMTDDPYTALWSSTDYGSWEVMTADDRYNRTEKKFDLDNNNRVFIGLTKDTDYVTTDHGTHYYRAPDKGSRGIFEVTFDYEVLLPTQFKARIMSFTADLVGGSEQWGVTGTGALVAGSATVTIGGSGTPVIASDVGCLSAHTYAGEGGEDYFKITNLRVKTVAGSVTADLIVADIVAQLYALNNDAISSSVTMIESPGQDLKDQLFEDASMATALTALAALGDSQSPPRRYEVCIWEGGVLCFRPKGSAARAWYVDAADIRVNSTLSSMYNETYAIYRSNGTKRTVSAMDTTSQARYGMTRRRALSTSTNNSTEAQTHRDASLEDTRVITPRAGLTVDRLYDASGAQYPLWRARSGDTITIRNLSPTLSADVDKIRTFRIKRTSYNVDNDTIQVVPESELPTLSFLLARQSIS